VDIVDNVDKKIGEINPRYYLLDFGHFLILGKNAKSPKMFT